MHDKIIGTDNRDDRQTTDDQSPGVFLLSFAISL